jgi:hypothetical protein
LKNYSHWVSLVESEGLHTIAVEGWGELHYMDILKGFEVLPPRQKQAVWLMCIEDKSEEDVARIMGFATRPTPVQQYKNFGLALLMKYQEAASDERLAMEKKASKHKSKSGGENGPGIQGRTGSSN